MNESRNENFSQAASAARQETYRSLPFAYNVTKALEIVGDRAPTRKMDVSGMRNAIDLGRSVDIEHAKTVDVNKPLLLAHHDKSLGGRPLLIDGWHRAYRASEEGIPHLDAVEMTPEETAQVMYTMRGMDKVKGVMSYPQAMKKFGYR